MKRPSQRYIREHSIPRKKWLISDTSGCALAEVIAIITIELRASCIGNITMNHRSIKREKSYEILQIDLK